MPVASIPEFDSNQRSYSPFGDLYVRGHTATPVDTHCRVCGSEVKSLTARGSEALDPTLQASMAELLQKPKRFKRFIRHHKQGIQLVVLAIFGTSTALGVFLVGQLLRP
jgi:hypothetical protein